MTQPHWQPGTLINARGRDWVVLPDSTPELTKARPLTGHTAETTGIIPTLETIKPAGFDPPDPEQHLGDAASAQLLHQTLQLGHRSGAGPFRSAGHLNFEPRPYQLVPLLMALKLNPTRLLIADDVGVGKTIEAGLIARELLDNGDAQKLAVLCPPHLAEQWKKELKHKFHINATPVLASTAHKLEKHLTTGQSLFETGRHFIVSTDFIKTPRRFDDFIRTCPDLVIIDEAHTCVTAGTSNHQRQKLVTKLADNPDRHLILVTATPHSGKDEAFKNLLTLLNPDFRYLPDDLSGTQNRKHRDRLAKHLIQRRRADITDYLGTDTDFPARYDADHTYQLTEPYQQLFRDVISYTQQTMTEHTNTREQRIRWWSALSLLRALASSPAAAAATLRTRTVTAPNNNVTIPQINQAGKTLIDLNDTETINDTVGGAYTNPTTNHQLRQFAEQADQLHGQQDQKILESAKVVQQLLAENHTPIIFCRFINTAEYVQQQLQQLIKPKIQTRVITGELPNTERETRVKELRNLNRGVLVATDCLSEGINLQNYCTAVIHYDLPWNPTRLEQREGRVDRFGQKAEQVKIVTIWGQNNYVDETVLKILLNKHKKIRKTLGVSIPVPGATGDVIEALAENILKTEFTDQQTVFGFVNDATQNATQKLELAWEKAYTNTQKRRKSLFAHQTIKPDQVAEQIHNTHTSIGGPQQVRQFVETVLQTYGAGTQTTPNRNTIINLTGLPTAITEIINPENLPNPLKISYQPPTTEPTQLWTRTHPAITGLTEHLLNHTLDPTGLDHPPIAARCGTIRTEAVNIKTVLFVCRARMTITSGPDRTPTLAEETFLTAYQDTGHQPNWLTTQQTEQLLTAQPAANLHPNAAKRLLHTTLNNPQLWEQHIKNQTDLKAAALETMHNQVREAGRQTGRKAQVTAHHPTDILGAYIYLPHT